MKKIGAITVGQAPRVDVTPDIMGILGEIELIQMGALDGLTKDEIAEFKPEEGDYILVSRLNDGSSVSFAERCILPRLQQCIYDLEEKGVSAIMVFCTGEFPEFKSSVPLIVPCKLLNGIVPALTNKSNIAVITPLAEQVEQAEGKWRKLVKNVVAVPASPYGDFSDIEKAAQKVKYMDEVDLIVLDCIGYTVKMKREFAEVTGKNVVLSRTILAHVTVDMV